MIIHLIKWHWLQTK